jgi:hypothetical protein
MHFEEIGWFGDEKENTAGGGVSMRYESLRLGFVFDGVSNL